MTLLVERPWRAAQASDSVIAWTGRTRRRMRYNAEFAAIVGADAGAVG